jgi:hypothetical protein
VHSSYVEPWKKPTDYVGNDLQAGCGITLVGSSHCECGIHLGIRAWQMSAALQLLSESLEILGIFIETSKSWSVVRVARTGCLCDG